MFLFVSAVVAVSVEAHPPAVCQSPTEPAVALVSRMVANELKNRAEPRLWAYVITSREGNQTVTKDQVETQDGPLYRVLTINGAPLAPEQRRQDDARMEAYLHDPSQQSRLKESHQEDEQKFDRLLRLLPEAFLYDYDGAEGALLRLKFRPNPNYNPPSYEATLIHNMAGTMLIDARQSRLAKVAGRLSAKVEFGFGFLGHIDEGGTIELGRTEVAPSEWKTALAHIEISGRLLLFKTVNKQQYETRSNYRAVASDLRLWQARAVLQR